jgi:hypothetical protein
MWLWLPSKGQNRMNADRDSSTIVLPVILIIAGIVALLAMATVACALTSQAADSTPVPTATNVPQVQVVVVTDTPALGATLDPAFLMLTSTAAARFVPTIAPVIVQQVVPTTAPVIAQQVVPVTPLSEQIDVQVYTPLNVPLPAGCAVRTDWTPYTIQAGDTIGGLAIATNTALADLVIGNCLTTPDVIEVGQTVYLPQNVLASYTPLATVPPGVTAPHAGFVLAEPSVVNAGTFLIAPGNVTLRAQAVENAATVSFYTAPIGTTSSPVLIGTDQNLSDGVTVMWQVNAAPFVANVWTVAAGADGVQDISDPILVTNNG